MSHVSVKTALHQIEPGQAKEHLHRARQGTVRLFSQNHADDIYKLPSGAMIKIRTYHGGRQEIILEKVEEEFVRQSKIAVGFMRKSSRDNDVVDVLGPPELHVSKHRVSYKFPQETGIRLYHDRFENGQSYLEWQMDDHGRPSIEVASDLKKLVLEAGFREEDILYESYTDMFLSSLFNEKSAFTPAYSCLPEVLKKDVLGQPVCKMDHAGKLFSKGERGEQAILISGGSASVHENGAVLKPGQLVGEFSSLEGGKRVCDVTVSDNFIGYRVEGRLLEELMISIPANAQKYLTWRREQVQKTISGP